MTLQEVKDHLKIGDYGEIALRNKLGYHVICMGTIIFISKKGTVTFYDDDQIEHHKKPEEIKFFDKKDKLPAPVAYKGRDVVFDGGHWIYKDNGSQVEFKDRTTRYIGMQDLKGGI